MKKPLSIIVSLMMILTLIPHVTGVVSAAEPGVVLVSLTHTESVVAEAGNKFSADGGIFESESNLTAWNNNQQITIGGTGRTPIVINNAAADNNASGGNGWRSVGSATIDDGITVDTATAFQIEFKTTGHDDIRFTCRQKSTGSGPEFFALAYSLDGPAGPFVPISDSKTGNVQAGAGGSGIAAANSYSDYNAPEAETFTNFALPAQTANQNEVYLRVYMVDSTTTTRANGNTSINDIIISSGEVEVDYSTDIEVPDDEKLVFSMPAGIYSNEFDLTLSTGYANGKIRYTTDGSDPTDESPAFTASLLIRDRTSDPNVMSEAGTAASDHNGRVYYEYPDGDPVKKERPNHTPNTPVYKGTVVKAQVFSAEGNALTDVYTNSYFINPKYKNLPIISVSTDAKNLFEGGVGKGIFHQDNVGARGLEKTSYFELFEPGEIGAAVSQSMAVRINGGASRGAAQKSFRFYTHRGTPVLQYDLFDGNAVRADGTEQTVFYRFILRNAGNDNPSALMRDALLQDLSKDLNTAYQAYRQSVVFVNGEFWGIYNIRERYDDYMLADKFKIADRSKIGILSNGGNQSEEVKYCHEECREAFEDGGPEEHIDECVKYTEMWDWFNSQPALAEESDYAKAQTFMDIDSFIDSYIVNLFGDNRDWPGNNNVAWRYRTEYPSTAEGLSAETYQDGRWRWMLKDADWIFNLYGDKFYEQTPGFDSINRLINPPVGSDENTWATKPYSLVLFNKLITNQEFVKKFVNRYCDILNTYFEKQRIINKVDEMAGNISGEPVDQHDLRWPGVFFEWSGKWYGGVNNIRNYVSQRQGEVFGHLKNTFKLGDAVSLTVNTDTSKGYATVNAIVLNENAVGKPDVSSWSGKYFKGMRQTITASPVEGYKLEKFIVNGVDDFAPSVDIVLEEDTTVEAVFAEDIYEQQTSPVIINQVYGTGTATDGAISHSFIELYNTSDEDIILNDYSIQAVNGIGAWNVLPLTGETIKAKSFFLIVSPQYVNTSSARYTIPNGQWDMEWNTEISNKAFSVALVNGQKVLSNVVTAREWLDVLNFVSALNNPSNGDSVNNNLGKPVTDVSKQKSARRKSYSNTGDNARDFESLDYRSSNGINNERLAQVRPRWSGDKTTLGGAVTISGTAKLNERLTAVTTGLYAIPEGAAMGKLSYQWKRGDVNIGTNSAVYRLVSADLGQMITVTVTAENCVGGIVSDATAAVLGGVSIGIEGNAWNIPADIHETIELRLDGWIAQYVYADSNNNPVSREEEGARLTVDSGAEQFSAVVRLVNPENNAVRYVGIEKAAHVSEGTTFEKVTWVIPSVFSGDAVMKLKDWVIIDYWTDANPGVLRPLDDNTIIAAEDLNSYSAIIRLESPAGRTKLIGIEREMQ